MRTSAQPAGLQKRRKAVPVLPILFPPIGRPLLKWAGGKRRLAERIIAEIGNVSSRYFEPFLGGGAIFFRLAPNCAYLSDLNDELIECYCEVRDHPEKLAGILDTMRNSSCEYYRIRASVPTKRIERAARFIYLTTLSFNGIYRQNLRGEFNVPYGHKLGQTLPTLTAIMKASAALSSAHLLCCDFEESSLKAVEGDVVYFDPPYTVAHNNNGFVKYNSTIFSWQDQLRLSRTAKLLAERGCRVIVSNANHPSVRRLYKDFDVQVLSRASVIAAKAEFRVPVTECLFVSPG